MGHGNSLFDELEATWTLKDAETGSLPHGRDMTEVVLRVKCQFSNPLVSTMVGEILPKVAGKLSDSFEQRAQQLLHNTV